MEIVMAEGRAECKVLGKVIGTYTDWDQTGTWSICMYEFQPNDLGMKFLRNQQIVTGNSLFIEFDTGIVSIDGIGAEDTTGPIEVDWSAFND